VFALRPSRTGWPGPLHILDLFVLWCFIWFDSDLIGIIHISTWDFSDRPTKSKEHPNFIKAQVETEVQLGCYSAAFGPDLLPGMYSSPVHAVDKPGMTTFCLINDQSAGEFSPNSMIDSEDVAGTCMDGIKSLGTSLHAFHKVEGDLVKLIMWKSDIEAVYCNFWLAKEWQVKWTASSLLSYILW